MFKEFFRDLVNIREMELRQNRVPAKRRAK